jgi:hypothetical protein
MFRNQKEPYENMKVLFDLSQELVQRGTQTDLIGAYSILSALQRNYPDKAFQPGLAIVEVKLRNLGQFEQVFKDGQSVKNNGSITKDSVHTRAKL